MNYEERGAIERENRELRARLRDAERTLAGFREEEFRPQAEKDELEALAERALGIADRLDRPPPTPLPGESVENFTLRVAQRFQGFSAVWGGSDLRDLSGPALALAAEQILRDAEEAAHGGEALPGRIVTVREKQPGGREIVRSYGDPMAWFKFFCGPGIVCKVREDILRGQ